MNLDEMKKLYESEPDKWIAYYDVFGEWFKSNQKAFIIKEDTKLIHKDHEAIADAVIANPDVEIDYRWNSSTRCSNVFKIKNFFEEYKHNTEHFEYEYWLSTKQNHIPDVAKMIQINNMEDLNKLPILGEEDGSNTIRNDISSSTSNNSSDNDRQISITDEDGKVCEFEKIARVELKFTTNDRIIGIANDCLVIWFKKCGTCFNFDGSAKPSYNLTPIQKKWYNNPKPFTLVVHTSDNTTMYIFDYVENGKAYDKDDTLIDDVSKLRLATKQERDSLYCEE